MTCIWRIHGSKPNIVRWSLVYNTGTYKVRNEIETKRNEINENETKRNETKSTKTKRNETKSTKWKRNETKPTK